jgi:hypothetical protein
MARLRNVRLNVGPASSGNQFVHITYDVDFEEIEIRLNMWFSETIAFLDRDGKLDNLLEAYGNEDTPGLALINNPQGNRDDAIALIITTPEAGTTHVFRPDGRTSLTRDRRLEFRFPDNESGPEEYRALVIVTPQVWGASAWSNEVSINLA